MSFFDSIKNTECEHCKKTIEEVFEGDEDNEFLGVIASPWYCSEWCYKMEDKEFEYLGGYGSIGEPSQANEIKYLFEI